MITIRAFFPKIRAVFSNFEKGQGRPLPTSPPTPTPSLVRQHWKEIAKNKIKPSEIYYS